MVFCGVAGIAFADFDLPGVVESLFLGQVALVVAGIAFAAFDVLVVLIVVVVEKLCLLVDLLVHGT